MNELTQEDKIRNKVYRERISKIKQEIKYHKQLTNILLNDTSFVNLDDKRAQLLISKVERRKLNKVLRIFQAELISKV